MTDLVTNLSRLLDDGSYLSFLYAFLAGILSSLTPCVYPLIPITLAIFGAHGETSRLRAASLSLSYVSGIAITYTTLGIISARTGALFGSLLSNPYITLCVVALLIYLALFTLDLVPIPFLGSLQTSASTVGNRGLLGAFLMGTLSGVVAAPCVGPVLVVILGIIASEKDALWGGALMLCYSLGLGVLFVILGIFSGLLSKLPRSGTWLVGIKFLISASVFGFAFYLLFTSHLPSIPIQLLGKGSYTWIILGGTLIAIWKFKGLDNKFISASFAGIIGLAGALTLTFATLTKLPVGNPTTYSEALAQSEAVNKIILLDLYADWCGACKELEALTFPDPKVKDLLSKFVFGRIDMTEQSKDDDELLAKYSVIGLPCLLFLNSQGEEIPGSRITGFLPPQKFAERLNEVLSQASLTIE